MSRAPGAGARSAVRRATIAALAALAGLLLTLVANTPEPALAEAANPIVAPAAGKVVRAHVVRIRVRSRYRSGVLQVRLNGVSIGDYFGPAHGGVRRLAASASYGLRRGTNRLAVRVRRRGKPALRRRVRFQVRSKKPLVGAGRDGRVVVDGDSQLHGLARGADADHSKLRWKVITAPAPLEPPHAIRRAELSSPRGATAGFHPTALGTYVIQLRHGSGARAVSDRVRIDAVPPNPLVSIDSEHTATDGETFDGIEVGDHLYPNERWLQVLVLDRKTLAPISNASFSGDQAAQLRDQIGKLHDDTELVIVSTGGWVGDHSDTTLPTDALLKRIGVPPICKQHTDCLPAPGQFSAIGVPGMKPGSGTWKYRPIRIPNPDDNGGMNGFLTPDQYLNYGFVPSQREPFSYGGEQVPACPPSPSCPDDTHIGYLLGVRNAYTLKPGPGDGTLFETNGRDLTPEQQSAEARRMAAALKAVPEGDLVTIQVATNRDRGETVFQAAAGPIERSAMAELADAVAGVGGTRNAFNRTARLAGLPATGGAVYALVGWAGAKEGAGAEVAAGVDGAGDVPHLSGALRPDRDSQFQFRPAEVAATEANPQILQDALTTKPSGAWPLDDDPGARRAIAYLGSTDKRLGPDPRSAYWTQGFDEATTNAIIAGLRAVPFPPAMSFTETEFEAAQAELIKELGWVGNVRTYLRNLSAPFADNALPSWIAAQKIADQVYESVHKPEDEVAFRWVELTRIILGLFGPATHEVTGVLGHALDLGVWAYGAGPDGTPTDQEIRIAADELGAELVQEAQQAQATFARMGDVIVSDYDKLEQIGRFGGCNPTAPDCPPELAFSIADKAEASANVYRSIERVAYTKLLPLAFHVFVTAPDESLGAPYPPDYTCTGYQPWRDFTNERPYAWTPLLQALSPLDEPNTWEMFLLAEPPHWTSLTAVPPSDEILDRMFGPVSPAGPKAGGLGMSLARLAFQSEHYSWRGNRDAELANCLWGH